MLNNFMIENKDYWKILEYLEALESETYLSEICKVLRVSEDSVFNAINFLNKLNYKLQLNKESIDYLIKPPQKKVSITFDLTLLEWISLQAHLPLMQQFSQRPFHKKLVNKIDEIENSYKEQNLLEAELFTLHKYIYKDFVPNKKNDQKKKKKSINNLVTQLDNRIKKNVTFDLKNSFNFSSTTQEEFRLIIKVFQAKELKFDSIKHLIKNPYMALNTEGNIIWAATVPAKEEILVWLLSIEQIIEILDPHFLKKTLKEYRFKQER